MGDKVYTGGVGPVGRIVATVWLGLTFIYVIVFNAFAGPGGGPFTQSTGNVSDILFTCITPAGYTFSIWAIIYTFLTYIVGFGFYLLWRKPIGSAMSVPFIVVVIINFNLNVAWLFAWDAVNVTGSFILLLFVALTNTLAMCLAVISFGRVASDLYESNKVDFWQSIVVLNGYLLYDTWTTLATNINLTAFFMYEVGVEGNGVCIGVLVFLMVLFIGYFIAENTILAYWGNTLFTHYAVLLWANIGIYVEQKDKASNEVIALVITLIAVSATLLLARIIILIIRNRNNQFYGSSRSAKISS